MKESTYYQSPTPLAMSTVPKTQFANTQIREITTLAMAESDSKKERTEDACATAAMTDYVKANDALVQQTATAMSVEATIAQRRLQEEYCLRFVRCSLDDQNSAIFGVQFDSCLKDEALEKYDAIPADTD